MKKNKAMRAAGGLLIATLLSTSAVSGTFAKYVTSGSGSDNARVAKWGVTVTANGSAFGTAYKSADGKISATYTASTDSVNSSNTDKVVAPGTGDDVVAAAITGTPEVDCKIVVTADLTVANWTVSSTDYFPIIFTVGGVTYGMQGSGATNSTYTSTNDLISAVEAAASKDSASATVIEAGTDLSTLIIGNYTPSISWQWDFDSTTAATNTYRTDEKDTALGNAAATGNAATIQLDYTVQVVQVD